MIVPGVTTRTTSRSIKPRPDSPLTDRKSTRLNSSHVSISYAAFCLKKKDLVKVEPALIHAGFVGQLDADDRWIILDRLAAVVRVGGGQCGLHGRLPDRAALGIDPPVMAVLDLGAALPPFAGQVHSPHALQVSRRETEEKVDALL